MQKLLASMVGLAALAATPALSADMPVKYVPPAPIWSWTGCYIGGNVGAGWRRTEWTVNQVTGMTIGARAVSFVDDWGDAQVVGGAQAGCNYQFYSNWLIGFELGATAAQFGPTHNILIAPNLGSLTLSSDHISNSHGIYSAAARLGWTWDRWLAYVKGGYAGTTIDLQQTGATTGLLLTAAHFRANGFVAGAGVEYALTDHLIGGIEYDYYGFRPSDSGVLVDIINPGFSFTDTGIRHDVQTVTARLSFFWGPPAYAPPPPVYTK